MCKKILVFLLLFISVAALADVHRVGSYNIRYPADGDTLERAWKNRRPYVVKMLRDTMNYDVVALQEVYNSGYMDYLKSNMSGYTFYMGSVYGVALAYRTSKYKCLDKGYFKLVPSPKPAGWEALQTRWAVWVKLQDKSSGDIFYFASSHLDLYPISIREGARILSEKMREIAGVYPCIFAGDMNCEQFDRDPMANFSQWMGNARYMCKTAPKGSFYTFASGMDPEKATKWIDFVFVHDVEVESYFVNNATLGRTLMPSDHMPVVCEVTMLSPWRATTHVVNNVAELRKAAKEVQAGDIIYLNDGRYDLQDSTLTPVNSCVIEGSEKAVLTGSNQLIAGARFASLELRGLTIEEATSPIGVYGSIVTCNGNYLKMTDCRIVNCQTQGFGLVYVEDCRLDIDHCIFKGNQASVQEGGVYFVSGTSPQTFPLSITRSTFHTNTAYRAAALYFNSTATAYLYGNSFIGNEGQEKGAVHIDAQGNKTDIRLVNNTFAYNRIDVPSTFLDDGVGGSAVWQEMADDGQLTMMNNTVVGNYTACRTGDGASAPDFVGGAVQSRSGVLALYNNIIAGNYSSCSGRGDVSADSWLSVSEKSCYNVLSSQDNTNYMISMFDFQASSYAAACQELVKVLGGSADSLLYYPMVLPYGKEQDVYTLSPISTVYAGNNIAVLQATNLSAEGVDSDILNVGSKTGTLTLDQAGTVRLSPSVPGAMEAGVEPTDLMEVQNAQCTMQNGQWTMQSGKEMRDGQLRIIRDGRVYTILGTRL